MSDCSYKAKREVEAVANPDTIAFATDWIDSWNQRDLEGILSHYSRDIVFLSPIAQQLTGNGQVVGIDALRAYWRTGLDANPDLRFELIQVLDGHECCSILYRNQRGQCVAETVKFGRDGKIVRACACYGS